MGCSDEDIKAIADTLVGLQDANAAAKLICDKVYDGLAAVGSTSAELTYGEDALTRAKTAAPRLRPY